MRFFPPLLGLVVTMYGCANSRATALPTGATPATDERAATVILASELQWEQLNPARGDASPKAANVWGDRKGAGPTGFLVRFVDGFESPPHIHNVSYRGVVIRGLVHNDDPGADTMWMPVGSFWTQPKGDVHITAAEGDTVAYIEIDEGPYLVHPVDQAFSSDDRQVKVDAANVAWVDASSLGWGTHPGESGSRGPLFARLWGDPNGDQPSGALVKFPAGATEMIPSRSSSFRVVVIQGKPVHGGVAGAPDGTALEPGSYVASNGGSVRFLCEPGEDCVFYVRMEGGLDRSE